MTLVYLVHLFASGYDTFYYDSDEYWQAGKLFNDGGGFSLLSYDYEWRGYAIPLLSHVLDSIGGVLGLGDVTIVKIFGSLLAATLGVVVLPRLARALFPNAALGWERVLALNALLFLYWRDHFDFPLADFPALTAASVGVILLLRGGTWSYLLAGLSLGLAASMRGNYWFALVAAVAVAALFPLRAWNWKARGAAVGLVLIGAFVISVPQMLMNHRHHGTWSPSIAIAKEQHLIATWLGMRAQKYETYVGPTTGYPLPQVLYLDPSTQRLLEEEGITPVTRLGRPSFPSNVRYLELFAEHPITMSASYGRHLFNGLDVKYPTPYIRDLDDRSTLLSLLNYTLLFVAFARLLVPGARRALGGVRWSGMIVLASALFGVINGAGRATLLPACDRARVHARLLRAGYSINVGGRKQAAPSSASRFVRRLPPPVPDALFVDPGRDRVSASRRPQRSTLSTPCRRPREARRPRRRSTSRRPAEVGSRSRSSSRSTTKRRTSTSSTAS